MEYIKFGRSTGQLRKTSPGVAINDHPGQYLTAPLDTNQPIGSFANTSQTFVDLTTFSDKDDMQERSKPAVIDLMVTTLHDIGDSILSTPTNDDLLPDTGPGPQDICTAYDSQRDPDKDEDSESMDLVVTQVITPGSTISISSSITDKQSDSLFDIGDSLLPQNQNLIVSSNATPENSIARESPQWPIDILSPKNESQTKPSLTSESFTHSDGTLSYSSDAQLPDTQANIFTTNSFSSIMFNNPYSQNDSQLPDTQQDIESSLMSTSTSSVPGDSQTKELLSANQAGNSQNIRSVSPRSDSLLPETQQCGSFTSRPAANELSSFYSTTKLVLSSSLALNTSFSLSAFKSSAKPSTLCTEIPDSKLLAQDFKQSSTSLSKPKRNILSVKERKRRLLPFNRPANITLAMKERVTKLHALLDPFRTDEECWFHPSPPPARTAANGTSRPTGNIRKTFLWSDQEGKHSIILNYGIVSKLVFHTMTKQQKDGFISQTWHLSHLCGNWCCLNHQHTTVEPGSINISRNNCFSHRSGCLHTPQCMKEHKVSLGVDGKPIDHHLAASQNIAPAGDDSSDWTPYYDDDEYFMETELDDDDDTVIEDTHNGSI